ncbi:MAG: ABC transporter permease [Peptostreptococcaceae bacterium]|nr:ABC transporter permease [Peptostreptococcaceae bacterium]
MIKIIKREDVDNKFALIVRALAIVGALLFTGVFIALIGYDPIKVFYEMFFGAVGTPMRLQETINKAVPLVITSLGILVAFKMKFWNIGGEGQIIMGALGASFVALNYAEALPRPILLLVMAAASILMGGIWALIPAVFKIKMGTNETIFTLMLNYVAIKIVQFLQFGPWKDPAATGFPKIPSFDPKALLPNLFGLHIGWLIALVFTVLMYIFIRYTKKGYEIEVVGESIDTAKYAGMNVDRIILFAITLSGGLCGLVGMIQASAMEKTLSYTLSGGYGYTAIITTWLCGLKTQYIPITSIAFAILLQGGSFVQVSMQIPSAVAGMIQGIILFFVLGSEFFIKYKLVGRAK